VWVLIRSSHGKAICSACRMEPSSFVLDGLALG
jgi:hypothetical protein